MSPEEVRKKIDPSLTIEDRKLSEPVRTGMVAFTQHGTYDGADPYEGYLLEFVNERLAYIRHIQVFGPGAEPLGRSVADALTELYGQRSWGSPMYPSADWNRDASTSPIVPRESGFCLNPPGEWMALRGSVNDGRMFHNDGGNVPTGGPVPTPLFDITKVCGRILTVEAPSDPTNQALVSRINVVLFEGAPFFSLDADRRDAAKKKLDDVNQAAQVNKPHL